MIGAGHLMMRAIAAAPAAGYKLYCWGANAEGQLAQGNTTKYSNPVQIGSLTDWKIISAGRVVGAIKADGTLWTWGYSGQGQVGDGARTNRSSPVKIGSNTDWAYVGACKTHCMAITNTGKLFSIGGLNDYGNLCQGDTTNRSSPVQVGALTDWKYVYACGQGGGAGQFTLAIKTDNTLWVCGYNAYGQLGKNNRTNYSSPVAVGALTNWKQAAGGDQDSMAVKTDGTLWAIGGLNVDGNLGLGNANSYSSPVQVGSDTDWAQVAMGRHSMAVKTDHTLWAIGGLNTSGQLGLGHRNAVSSPVKVGTLTDWAYVVCANTHTVAYKTDGTVWTFGVNTNGELGLGDIISRSSPVQVGSATTWKNVENDVYQSSFALST